MAGKKHRTMTKEIDPFDKTNPVLIEKPGKILVSPDKTTVKESSGEPLESRGLDITIGEDNLDIPIFSEEFLNYNKSKWF